MSLCPTKQFLMGCSDLIFLAYPIDLFYLRNAEPILTDDQRALFYKNLSLLFASPDLVPRLQELKPRFSFLHRREIVISFQWLGPHFLAFLKYATKLCFFSSYCNEESRFFRFVTKLFLCFNYERKEFSSLSYDRFNDLLKRLDDSASDCILYGETEHYKKFLEIIVSFMTELKKKFFTIQNLKQLSDSRSTNSNCLIMAGFINFLLETVGESLTCQTYSSVLVSNQVDGLLKELKFLPTFLVDTALCCSEEEKEILLTGNILTEIEAVSNEAGLFFHSFFFTADLVTETEMDLAISVLLERIEIVKEKIKDHRFEVSMKLNCGIESLHVAESPNEASSSQDKSIHVVEEIILGIEDMTTQIASKLLGGPKYRQIISVTGMGGLGKTTLAKKIYNDSSVRCYFDKLSWCVVSQTYKKRKLLIDILSSVSNPNQDKFSEMKDEELADRLYKNLKGNRYLIVMDDLWGKEAWNDLQRLFPDEKNGSRVLFTSRLKNVVEEILQVIVELPVLSPDESWNLLEQNVFKKEVFPQELQVIGKQIATNCHGLPLSVIIIAGILSNMEKNKDLWQQVEKSLSFYIAQKADDYIPTLKRSYMHLPNHLKPCFLYLTAFQEDEKILVRKLLSLWIAEGLIEEKEHRSIEDVAEEYLMEIIDRSLLQVVEGRSRSDNGVKECTLHDLVFDMCWKIAEEEEFLLDHHFLIWKNRHRLCKDRSHHLSKALSVLYDSEIRIWEWGEVFPEFIIMLDLRYLNISLSNMKSYISVLYDGESVINEIPAYLLNMPKLSHLRVGNIVFPSRFSRNCDTSRINSLQTICWVYIYEFKDEEILRCSPNLRTLKCTFPGNYFPDFNFLSQLESLHMVHGNRFTGDYLVVNFPRNIKKLTLSGLEMPWENMSLIGTLPSLEILKLKNEAFVGQTWYTKVDEFRKLKFLKLDSLFLEQWNSSGDHFPALERLVLMSCYKLEMIPSDFSNIPTLRKIEVHYCRKNVETSALEIREEVLDSGAAEFEVTIVGVSHLILKECS